MDWLVSRRGWVVAGLLVVLAAQLAWVAWDSSANWDEAHHLYDGYRIWRHGDYRLNAEVPPLVKLMAAAPLLGMRVEEPAGATGSQTQNAFVMGRLFVFGNGGDRVLGPARAMCAVWALVLGWLVYVGGRAWFGPGRAGVGAGLVGLGLWVFDPLVLAHGALVSTDMASACLLFGAVLLWWRYAERPGAGRLVAVGVVTGLALVAKFTGILVEPVLLLLAVAEGVWARRWGVLGRRVLAWAAVGVMGWAVVWGFYGFRYAPAGGGAELSPRLAPYLLSMPKAADGVRLGWVARHRLLPEAYVWGLANTKHTEWEYTSYFFGRVYRHGPWEYFPAAFLIKSTVPLLVLLVAAGVVWWGRGRGRAMVYLLVPVGVYGAVITASHFDIGARHLMPVYPFLYVLAGGTAMRVGERWGRAGWAVVGVLVGWQVVTSVRVAPAYMAYGNELWGGPTAVRRYLSDANVDWGQQLKAVRRYLEARGITDCWIGYFPDGAVEPRDYGVPCRRLPTPSGLWWLKLPMEVPPVIEGTVLLSESVLDGVESGDGRLNPYAGFQGVTPVAVIEHGVFVYQGRFRVPLAAAWVEVRRSGELARAGRGAEALELAREAEALAPGSARVELNLADRLAGEGQWAAARAQYAVAGRALAAERPDLQGEELGPEVEAGMRAVAGR